MQNLYLIGFMGSGKSTVAAVFQREFGMQLAEMDEMIAERAGMKIPEIFALYGETYFRNLESAMLQEIARRENQIVSCGGGAVLREGNVLRMKESGKIVLLTASPETIYERVKEDQNRPLLAGNMNVEYIAGLMAKRRAVYEAAADMEIRTDGKSAREICDEIIRRTDNV